MLKSESSTKICPANQYMNLVIGEVANGDNSTFSKALINMIAISMNPGDTALLPWINPWNSKSSEPV